MVHLIFQTVPGGWSHPCHFIDKETELRDQKRHAAAPGPQLLEPESVSGCVHCWAVMATHVLLRWSIPEVKASHLLAESIKP